MYYIALDQYCNPQSAPRQLGPGGENRRYYSLLQLSPCTTVSFYAHKAVEYESDRQQLQDIRGPIERSLQGNIYSRIGRDSLPMEGVRDQQKRQELWW